MKVIKIIDVKSNDSLYRVASALGELTLMRKIALENGAEEPKPIKHSMDAIMEVLTYKFQRVFDNSSTDFAQRSEVLSSLSSIFFSATSAFILACRTA